jgi:pimeloyl-ACP methyl ester carboxylesterase
MQRACSRRVSRLLHATILTLLAIGSLVTSGCVSSILANKIIRAPNQQKLPEPLKNATALQAGLDRDYYSLATKIAVSPHPAQLAVAVLEPRDYKFVHELKDGKPGTHADTTILEFHMAVAGPDKFGPLLPPKGTIVLLHGVMMTKESMLHWGFFLAQKGYRIVLVDLRGHGRSTGDIITYGAWETADLSQVLDDLTRRGIVTGRVGVLGLSYGGAIAIDWAAHEPRIATLVALAPFSEAREAIDEFGHAVMPGVMKFVSTESMTNAFALATQRGGFTWEQADVLAAARQLHMPILLIHGKNDTWIPLRHSERIKAAAPAGSRLLIGPGDHLTLSLRLDPIAEPVAAWFDKALTGS